MIKSIINKQGSLADALVTVDSKITDASSKIDPAVTDINAQVSSSTNTLTSTINTQVEGLSAKVDTATNTLSSKIYDQTTGLSSQMSNVANKVESSTNALTSKIDAQSIGTYEDLVTAKTVFGMLHKIFDKLAALDDMSAMMIDMQANINSISSQSAKIDNMSAMMIDMKTNIDRMSNQMANQTALSGSGYTYTMWTKRSYLEGYKLKLTDHTTSKSCYVAWDEDSEYWSGVLKAPLKADIWISLIDPSTGKSQGELSITPTLTDGCAVIDLDSLMAGQISKVLGVNGPLATEVYKDSYFTTNTSILPTIVGKLVENDEHLQDFLKSSSDLEISSSSFDELYGNVDEVVSIIAGRAGTVFLANGVIGQTIANTKPILKAVSQNLSLALKCNNVSEFNTYLSNSSLARKTRSASGGSANSVSGNLICISVTSGSRGNVESVEEREILTGGEGNYLNCIFVSKAASCHGTVTCVKGSTSYTPIQSGYIAGINGYSVHMVNGESTKGSPLYFTQPGRYAHSYSHLSASSANYSTSVGKFVDSVSVAAYGGVTASVDNVYLGVATGCFGTITASSPTANSVITYIDLNE